MPKQTRTLVQMTHFEENEKIIRLHYQAMQTGYTLCMLALEGDSDPDGVPLWSEGVDIQTNKQVTCGDCNSMVAYCKTLK